MLLKQTQWKTVETKSQRKHILLSSACEHGTFFAQQVRKRHCFAKGVQVVDALEVYQQRKNGELVVHSEKSVKTATSAPRTVSNRVKSFTSGLLVQEQLKKIFYRKKIMHICSLFIQFQKTRCLWLHYSLT